MHSQPKIPRGRSSLIMFAATILVTFSGIVQAQPADEGDTELQAQVIDRLKSLESLVDLEAQRAARITKSIAEAPPMHLDSVIDAFSKVDPLSTTLVSAIQTVELPTGASETTRQLVQQQVAVKQAQQNEQVLSDYSRYLRELQSAVAATPPGQVLDRLEMAYVPPEVLTIVNPVAGQPSTGAQPFAGPTSPGAIIPFVVGGSNTTVDYPSVAALAYDDPGLGLVVKCTGTLVAPNAVLTAAHCVTPTLPKKVFLQHVGVMNLTETVVHERYAWPFADLALVFLENSVREIAPAPLNTLGRLPSGTLGRVVGFGYHALLDESGNAVASSSTVVRLPGIKLHGSVRSSQCPPNRADKSLICWTYQQSDATAILGSTCSGDSGGPMFFLSQGGWVLAGVTSGGDQTCSPGDTAFDVEVFDFHEWISQRLAEHPAPISESGSFGPLSAVENSRQYAMAATYRRFTATSETWQKTFDIQPGVALLRVAVNATPSGAMLSLRAGKLGAALSCDLRGDSAVQSCEITNPLLGAWNVEISGANGQEFQVLAADFVATQ